MAPGNWNFKSLTQLETWRFRKEAPEPSAEEQERMDPHQRLMLRYKECPIWVYGFVLLISIVVGLICIYEASSGMSWWAFLIAVAMASVLILFMGAQAGMTGFQLPVQPIIQMIGAYLEPGRPLTNMYFTLYGYNSVGQGLLLLRDLKLGQYAKLSPRCTLTMQLVGTLVGSILNYFIMVSITDAQRDILLSIQGTHIWSGAGLQSFNTQAITWGGLAKHMYSWGSRYQWVPLGLVLGFVAPLPFYILHKIFPKMYFNKIHVPIVAWHVGWLVTGINSAIISFFLVAFWSQWYLRRWKPDWFLRFNYVLCAGLDGGTQVIIFILTFALFGASGKSVPFPNYWGNNANGNLDYCKVDPANG
ncbi:putative opt oligopeptide transporter protein [Phaeoacremonium minimum UCRPA7]|uniref:Putative opt oligopeptide transporter protein n=1 Tax=Phaeoacremonium minimum (strain UCR-PA7) TaxID=1286976 RepID=R8BXA8_PHAM7|nr:putative opt oligopeptide transporter protein [Phaeoacremonium minimum UCRPA7]EOO03914.1 putative opt oligopeptide transporter protein [Phaeoacremonium minimum UCRPA7]